MRYGGWSLKPCIKCGSTERGTPYPKNPLGECKACRRARKKAKIAERKTKFPIKPCRKCGAMDRNKNGRCTPCAQSRYLRWVETNPSRSLEIRAKWAKKNPEKRRIFSQNRRALVKSNGGKLSNNIAEKLLKLQQGKCACCYNQLEKYHLDHIMPVSLGGENKDRNIQLLCPTCNLQKNAKHPIDFMQSKGFLL